MREEMVLISIFYSAHCIVKLKYLSKKRPSLLMATLENVFSTWGNSRVQLFLSTRWCISLSLVAFGHSWYGEMHQLVLRKSWTRELPHVEKAFSNVAINKLVNFAISSFPCKTGKFVKSQCWKWLYKPSIGCGSFNSYPTLSDHSKSCLWILMPFLKT